MKARVFLIVVGALFARTATSLAAMYTIAINPSACNLIANELNHALGNNVNNVMAGVPAVELTLSKFISPSAGYQVETYEPELGWVPGLMTLNPGDAAFLNSPVAFNLTFTGTLPADQPCPTLVGGQKYLVSRRRGWTETGLGPSPYKDILGYDPAPGSTLYQFVPAGDCTMLAAPNYTVYTFAAGAWSPSPPMIPSGQAVWIEVPADLPVTYNVAIAAGTCNLIANELNACGGNNINNVLPASGLPAFELTLSKFISPGAGYEIETYDPGVGWVPGVMTLNPGEGAFLNSPVAFNATFKGNLPAAQPCKPMTPAQFYLLSRRAAGLGPSTYQDIVGAPPLVGSVLYKFVEGDCSVLAAPNFSVHTYSGGGVWADDGVPAVSVGQSVWVKVPAAGPTLTIGFGGAPCLDSEVKLTWDGGWQLQSADAVVGPWDNVVGAVSPFCYTPVLAKFFRLVCP